MIRKIFICIFILFCGLSSFAQDMIILRDGSEIQCKIELIGNGTVSYINDGESDELLTSHIYMIKYKLRGNVFYSSNGEVIYNANGNNKKESKLSNTSIAIYLREGAEIIASEINILENEIKYAAEKKGSGVSLSGLFGKKKPENWNTIKKDKVFLIRYGDGSKELVNSLDDNIKEPVVKKVKHPFIPINKDPLYPCPADIILNDGNQISVIIYDKEREYVHYRTNEWQDGPIFRMKLSKIKSILTKR